MTFKGWTAAVALLLACGPGVGHAVTEANFAAKTTGDIVELCDPQSDSAMANAAVNFCSGFAQGTVSLEMEHDAGSRSMKLFCLPDRRRRATKRSPSSSNGRAPRRSD